MRSVACPRWRVPRGALRAVALAVLILLGSGSARLGAARFSTVVIDPGHGGRDNGAKWGGVAEKHLTLDVARRVERALQARGVRTVLTRSGDHFVALESRAARANRYRDAVFVSIHFNASWKRHVTGVESTIARNNATKTQRTACRASTNAHATAIVPRIVSIVRVETVTSTRFGGSGVATVRV